MPETNAIASIFDAVAPLVWSSTAQIIPVSPTTKHPYLKDWPRRATDKIEILETWWRKWPDAMIGITTGAPSELWAIDIDYGAGGRESWDKLIAAHGALPDTIRYRTPGGYRYMFNWPAGATLKSRVKDIAPGIDVRGGSADGAAKGQVIVPPSVRGDGKKYEWDNWPGLWGAVDAPPWLLYMAMFGRRERALLARIGIGPETASAAFSGVPLAGWHSYGLALIRPPGRPVSDRTWLLPRGELGAMDRYVRKSVADECDKLAGVEVGERNHALGAAALSIHGLLDGAENEGMDVAEMTEWAHGLYCAAYDAMPEDAREGETADQRWERCGREVHPRDLSRLVPADITDEFEPIGDLPTGKTSPPKPASLIMHRGDTFDPESIDWHWQDRFAAGKLHLTAGYGDVGKTTLLLWIAAAYSQGALWPDDAGKAPVGSVIYFSTEDDKADTLLPRYIAAGGDRTKIHFVSGVQRDDGKGQRGFKYSDDMAKLEAAIKEIGDVRAVFLDPLNAYFGGTNSWHNSDVRGVLEPLAEMAARLRVALFGNTHFSKGSAANANMKVLDSVGIVNLARLVYIVTKDDENEDSRLFLPNKYNIAKKKDGLRFHIEERVIDAVKRINATTVVWDAADVTAKADDVLARLAKTGKGESALDAAVKWLRIALFPGPKPSKELIADAVNSGLHTEATLRRASKHIGVVATKIGMTDGWTWALPAGKPGKTGGSDPQEEFDPIDPSWITPANTNEPSPFD